MLKKHLDFVKKSLKILKSLKNKYENLYGLPLDIRYFSELSDSELIDFDSIAYRFSKIQSILAEKVFREILEKIGINTLNKNFLEILALCERNGIIDSTTNWKNLRYIRNSLSHDYPDELEEVLFTINRIFQSISFFEEIVENIEKLEN